MTPEWATSLLSQLKSLGYTGRVTLIFHKGGIAGVNFTQDIKGGDTFRMVAIG